MSRRSEATASRLLNPAPKHFSDDRSGRHFKAGQEIQEEAMGISRVVLYKHGVGYFERVEEVEGNFR